MNYLQLNSQKYIWARFASYFNLQLMFLQSKQWNFPKLSLFLVVFPFSGCIWHPVSNTITHISVKFDINIQFHTTKLNNYRSLLYKLLTLVTNGDKIVLEKLDSSVTVTSENEDDDDFAVQIDHKYLVDEAWWIICFKYDFPKTKPCYMV